MLAVTRHLAAAINDVLAQTISREGWAKIVVADYRALNPQRFGERAQRMRRAPGSLTPYLTDRSNSQRRNSKQLVGEA